MIGLANQKADSTYQSEYSVYIYHNKDQTLDELNDWEKRITTPHLCHALREAKLLHRSKGYRKVEIKERLLDPKTAMVFDQTLKVFPSKSRWLGFLSAV